jgi:adenine-specific DNA-methyltransferase
VELLDKNQLYVNYCDIDDEDYNISDADKAFTKSFYEGV